MLRIALIAVLAACSTSPTSSVVASLASSCPTAAVPDDGLDDRGAIQAACDAPQHCAYLPAGVYDVDSIPFTPPARRPYAMVTADGCEIYGDGAAATTVRFRGSAGSQDWEGIRLTGASPSLHDLTLRTTSSVTETGEQTHAVRVLGPSTSPSVYRVTIDHPVLDGWKRGDCIQFVAYNDGRLVSGARIHDVEFAHCDRSGVAAHSGVSDLQVVDSHFSDTGNTALDFEGTGDTHDVLIAFNRFELSPGPHGVVEIQLQLVDHARVTGNILQGRSIDVYQSDDVQIDHNTVVLTQTTGVPVIGIGKDSSRVTIDHNTLTRTAAAGTGAVIRAVPHGTGTPDHVVVADNTLEQQTGDHVIDTVGLVGLSVLRNRVTYTGAVGNTYGVLVAGGGSNAAPGIRATDIVVADNTWTGPLHGMLGLSGSYGGVGTASSSGNTASAGIVCWNVAVGRGITGPLTSVRDATPGPLGCAPLL
jgi:hypothetical protein